MNNRIFFTSRETRSIYGLPGRGASWFIFILLLIGSPWSQAADSERFLERLSSEARDDGTLVTVHFTQTLQYLSHTPGEQGRQLTIRFRKFGGIAASALNVSLGSGVMTLRPGPEEVPGLISVMASGDLTMDPGLIVEFDGNQRYQVRPGPDARSISILLAVPAGAAQQAGDDRTGTEGAAPEVPEFTGNTPEDRHLQNLFAEARKSVRHHNYQRATAIYDKIIAANKEPYRQEAILALGVVRAERQQFAQARAQFERYLEDYPDEPGAVYAQRHLDEVLTQEEEIASAGELPSPGASPASTWTYFGSFDQFYLYDGGKLEDRNSDTYRSSLLTSANLGWQGRTEQVDIGGRFSGSYDYSFLDERDSPTRVSYLYLDLNGRSGRHESRLGRQRLSGSGVLGYFDGLHYQYKLTEHYRLRYAGGSPVRSSRDGVDTDRYFNGLAIDYLAGDDSWFLSLYGLDQTVEGETDRRALGTEMRYFGDTYSLYSLLDYDFHFDELNIFHLLGNWRMPTGTVASLTLDHRRSPALSLSNALQGQGTDSLDDLQLTYSDEELEELALQRSLIYQSVYLSLTQPLTKHWQLMLDGGIYSLSTDESAADPTLDDVESDDWYLYSQVMASDLFKPGDTFTAGLRYADSERANLTSLLLRARFPVRDKWRLTPRLRLDYRERDDSAYQWRLAPSLFTTYRWNRKFTLEFDLGMEFRQNEEGANWEEPDEQYYYLSLGYRYDF